jgi:hypothetical protein
MDGVRSDRSDDGDYHPSEDEQPFDEEDYLRGATTGALLWRRGAPHSPSHLGAAGWPSGSATSAVAPA